VIVRDVEHAWGARATLERDTSPGPWAITCGVYAFGLHTAAFAIRADALATWDRVLDQLVRVLDAIPAAETPEEELDWSEASRLFGAIAELRRCGPTLATLCCQPPRLLLLHLALELLQRALQVVRHHRRGCPLRKRAEDARARNSVREAQLDVRAAGPSLAQAKAPALVEPEDGSPRQVGRGVELDELDLRADLG
jgi:hypothetical protein